MRDGIRLPVINIFWLALILFFSGGIKAQNIGDFRSFQSGNWNDPGSWELFGGTVWIPATSYPDDADASVTVFPGHSIIYNTSNISVHDLAVQAGAKLFANSTGVYRYLLVFGNISCEGIIGNGPTVDGISLKPEGDTCIIDGTGDCRFRRIRKDNSINDTTVLIFNMDVEIYYDGSSACFWSGLDN